MTKENIIERIEVIDEELDDLQRQYQALPAGRIFISRNGQRLLIREI